MLWPPNHKLVDISIAGVTDPDGNPVTVTVTSVRQDEPTNGLGDGDTPIDAVLQGPGQPVQIRAERSGWKGGQSKDDHGDGRVYHIDFTASDGRGGVCTGSVTTCVPHDQGKGAACVDEGPLYDSLR
jgi:hypothetical protein